MRLLALAVPTALVAALAATPSFAFPHIDVTNSETLSSAPLRVRTTFTVALVGYEPGAWQGFEMLSSGAGPLVHFYECQAPATWQCGNYLIGTTEHVFFGVIPGNGWDGAQTFSIVTDQTTPCVRFTFDDPVFAHYETQGCLAVDMPTPARPATWGSVKSLYR